MDCVVFDVWASDGAPYIEIEMFPYRHLKFSRDESLIFHYTHKADRQLRCPRFIDAIWFYSSFISVIPMALRALEGMANCHFKTVSEICYFIEDLILKSHERFMIHDFKKNLKRLGIS